MTARSITRGAARRLAGALALPLALAAGLAGCDVAERGQPIAGAPGRTEGEQRVGAQAHQEILQAYGGAYTEGQVDDYVREIGMELAAATPQAGAPWTFTVLDSPVVNAFAIPGGYVYVSRGLVALADDEAELAGVIGHEIGHVVADHSQRRQTRGALAQVGALAAVLGAAALGAEGGLLDLVNQAGAALGQGAVASYSRTQELEADELGVRYLAGAGYDPSAQADFLESMRAQSELAAALEGATYDPNKVGFFATHPANAERVREAARLAETAGAADGRRQRERFLAAVDGMIYGDSPEQGYVRGTDFIHPELGFRFSTPEGFVIRNSAAQVTAEGPRGAALVFDGGADPGGPLTDYIARRWVPALAEAGAVGELRRVERVTIGGREAAQAYLPVNTRGGRMLAQLTAIRAGDGIYRFFGVAPPNDERLLTALDRAAESWRPLSPAEARAAQPLRLRVVEARSGDTVESLARRMAFDRLAVERFRVLNDLGPGEAVRPGERVKLVVEG